MGRWHNNGKLLFQADAIFAGYTGQCMALMCFLPGRYIGNASAPGWTYIVGCPNNGPPFVLSCARLSHSSGSSPAQVCPRMQKLFETNALPGIITIHYTVVWFHSVLDYSPEMASPWAVKSDLSRTVQYSMVWHSVVQYNTQMH